MQKSLGIFLNTAIYRALNMFRYDPTNTDLIPFLEVMDYLSYQLGSLGDALRLTFT